MARSHWHASDRHGCSGLLLLNKDSVAKATATQLAMALQSRR